MIADPRRWTNLRGLARALVAPRPLPPWHAYEDREGLPAITLAPVALDGAPENDIAEEAPDAS